MNTIESTNKVQAPQLPAAYELISLDQVESLRTKAIELARNGVDEGTLIWTQNQSFANARMNKSWICNTDDLHCALILRPEFEHEKFYQMLIIAVVSLGNAIASHVTPMTALGYLWPNDIAIADHKIASVWLDEGKNDDGRWLCITLSCNVLNSPDDEGLMAMSIRESQGTTQLNNQVLLESFSREFIKQINNWSERGFDYIFDQWHIRLGRLDELIELDYPGKRYTGYVKNITPMGDLEIAIDDNHLNLTIQNYMELDP